MRYEHVRAGAGHRPRLPFAEDIRRGQEVELSRRANHLDLLLVADAGLLEALAEPAVVQADGGKVLHAREAHSLQLGEEHGHRPERIGAADTTGKISPAISTTIAFASPYGSMPAIELRPAIL